MVIAKHGLDLSQSEIVKELTKVASDKGLLTSEVKVADLLKKTASVSAYLPSDNLEQDCLKLVSGLKDRGYIKEAEELEDSFHLYRLAKKELYDSELIDFAHPEGDPEVAPAKNELGKVENITSTQDKMLQMVYKKPTGKLAIDKVKNILKLATLSSTTVINELIIQLYGKDVGELLWFGEDLATWDDDANLEIAKRLTPLIEELTLRGKNLGKDPNAIWEQIKDLMFAKKHLGSWYETRTLGNNLLDVGRLFFAVKVELQKELEAVQQNKTEETKEEKESGELVAAQILSRMIHHLEETKRYLGNILAKENNPDLIAWASTLSLATSKLIESLAWWQKKADGGAGVTVPVIIKTITEIGKKYKQPINIPTSNGKYPNTASLLYWAKNWHDIITGANKTSQGSIKLGQQPRPGSAPGTSPAGSAAVKSSPSGNQSSSSIKEMQTNLLELGKLVDEQEGLKTAIEDLKIKVDGLWGPQTDDALKMAEQIRSGKAVFPNPKDLFSSVPQLMMTRSVQAAKHNAEALKKMLEIAKTAPAGKRTVVLDEIGNVPLTPSDLLSPYSFYRFARKAGLIEVITPPEGGIHVNLTDLYELMKRVQDRALNQDRPTEDLKAREKSIYYVEAASKLIEKFYTLLKELYAKQSLRGEKLIVPVEVLQSAGGSIGFSPAGSAFVSPGQRVSLPDGREGIQVTWSSNIGQSKIISDEALNKATQSGIEIVSPITRFIDLKNPVWNLPEKFRLDLDRWMSANPQSLSEQYEVSGGINKQVAQQRAIEASRYAGVPRKWDETKRQYILIWPDNQGRPTQALYALTIPEIKDVYDRLSQDQLGGRAFLDFLRRLKSEIKRVYSDWNQQVPVSNDRMGDYITTAGRQTEAWITAINRIMDRLTQ